MSRVSENEEIRDYVDTMCKDEEILTATIENPTYADSVSFATIATYLMDISKSLAVIADTMTGGVEKDARDN